MKKLIVVIFALAMLLAFVGCNKSEDKLNEITETELDSNVVSAWFDCGETDYLVNYTYGDVVEFAPNCPPRIVSHDVDGFIEWYNELNH